jgi:hypothetical protein
MRRRVCHNTKKAPVSQRRKPRPLDHVRNSSQLSHSFSTMNQKKEPQVRIELTTARLRIECSTTELLWREVLLCPDSDSNRDALRHHPLKMACLPVSPPGHCTFTYGPYFPTTDHDYRSRLQITTTGATGLEPATSRVTVECSNQTELRPLLDRCRSALHPFTCRGEAIPACNRARCAPTSYPAHQGEPIAPTGVEPVSAP